MKQVIPIFSLAILFAACNSNPNTSAPLSTTPQAQQTIVVNADTAGLAQFQQWKAANELAAVTAYKASATQHAAAPVRKTKRAAASLPQSAGNTAASNNTSTGTDAGTMSSESSNTAKAAQKKGWSKAAKGTAIGAGTGAVLGAVINKKNRVAGGVIGGVAGGAVGYGIGRHMDKQDGRY